MMGLKKFKIKVELTAGPVLMVGGFLAELFGQVVQPL